MQQWRRVAVGRPPSGLSLELARVGPVRAPSRTVGDDRRPVGGRSPPIGRPCRYDPLDLTTNFVTYPLP